VTPAAAWPEASGCGTWTVGQLVSHVIGATAMYVALLEGAAAADVIGMMTDAVYDPASAERDFVAAATELRARLGQPTKLTRVVHHPAGDISGDELLGFALVEWTVHGWDLARAVDIDYAIDVDLAEVMFAQMEPVAARLGSLGAFTAAIPTPPDAGPAERLFGILGRPWR
jgi:uncharacterized protein (TIGR03086 family)